MEIEVQKIKGVGVATVYSDVIILNEVQDALDLMANCNYKGAQTIILKKENIHPDFFELKTGLAGDILQKFSNYHNKLAIIGDFSDVKSKSLRDFIFESNKAGRILFIDNIEKAYELFF